MRFPATLLLLAATASLSSCASSPEASVRTFPMAPVPSVVGNPSEYITLHYWDQYTADSSKVWKCDSSTYAGISKEEYERHFATWNSMLSSVPKDVALKSIGRLYSRSRSFSNTNAFDAFLKTSERYFYDPNSPYRDEDFFGVVASAAALDPMIPDSLRASYSRKAGLCQLNAYGTPAADFEFEDARGRRFTLYGIKAELTVLLFSNPGCNACKEIMDSFAASARFQELVTNGRVAVVNIYPDEDLDAWRGYLPTYPKIWHSGFDPHQIIRDGDIYSMRAIPSLYLLDADKKVILKDCPTERLLFYLDKV